MAEVFSLPVNTADARRLARYVLLMNTIRRVREEIRLQWGTPYFASHEALAEWAWACKELAAMNGGRPVLTVV